MNTGGTDICFRFSEFAQSSHEAEIVWAREHISRVIYTGCVNTSGIYGTCQESLNVAEAFKILKSSERIISKILS